MCVKISSSFFGLSVLLYRCNEHKTFHYSLKRSFCREGSAEVDMKREVDKRRKARGREN